MKNSFPVASGQDVTCRLSWFDRYQAASFQFLAELPQNPGDLAGDTKSIQSLLPKTDY